MMNEIGFHLVFFVQIWLLSYYYPQKKSETIKYVLDNHPPSEYPKLYPHDPQHYERKRSLFLRLTGFVYSMGLVLLGIFLHYDYSNADPISPIICGLYFMVQMLPFAMLEFTGFFDLSRMRKHYEQRRQKLDLQPRNLLSFVPAWSVALSISIIVGYVLLVLVINDFQLFGDNNAAASIGILLAGQVFLFGLMFYQVYGKKLNPYQASKDRRKDIQLHVRGLLIISTLASLFLILETSMNYWELDALRSFVLSLYFVAIGYFGVGLTIQEQKPNEMDFSVYKATADSP